MPIKKYRVCLVSIRLFSSKSTIHFMTPRQMRKMGTVKAKKKSQRQTGNLTAICKHTTLLGFLCPPGQEIGKVCSARQILESKKAAVRLALCVVFIALRYDIERRH